MRNMKKYKLDIFKLIYKKFYVINSVHLIRQKLVEIIGNCQVRFEVMQFIGCTFKTALILLVKRHQFHYQKNSYLPVPLEPFARLYKPCNLC